MAVTTGSRTDKAITSALDSMKRRIDHLPLLPQVLVRIMQLRSEQNDYFEQIARLAREDPPFSVRLIAVANSALSSPVTPIRSIKDALTRIGASTITGLVASLAVQRVFVPSSPGQVALWRHSIRVAVAAEAIAALVPSLKVDKGQAYLAGLLHDIGRFVMFEHAPEELLRVDESRWHSPEELIEADVEVFKFTHSELGYFACARWGIPDDIAEVVRRHHEKLDGSVTPAGTEAYILCIEIADRLDAMLLEQRDVSSYSTAELIEEIDQKCLWSPEVRALVPADLLASRIGRIATQSAQLLAGLGLS